MSGRSAGQVTIVDYLMVDASRRRSIEEAIHGVLDALAGGPWVVTLRPPAFPDDQVSVMVRAPKSTVLTSVSPDASPEEFASRLARGLRGLE